MRRPVWGMMSVLAVVAGLAALLWSNPAAAQSRRDDERADARPRPQITVRPGRKLVRDCEAWYATEHRLAGTVVTPQMRCWWTYR